MHLFVVIMSFNINSDMVLFPRDNHMQGSSPSGGGYLAGLANRKLVRHFKRAPKGHLGILCSVGPGLSTQSHLHCVAWSSDIETGPSLDPFYTQALIYLQLCQSKGPLSRACRPPHIEHHYSGSHFYYPLCGCSMCTDWFHKRSKISLVSMLANLLMIIKSTLSPGGMF